jgi:hypothetical protein
MSPDIACGPTGTANLNDNRRKWTETLVSRARRQLGEVNGRLSLRIVAEQGKHCSRVARVLLTFCEKAKSSRFPSEANHRTSAQGYFPALAGRGIAPASFPGYN